MRGLRGDFLRFRGSFCSSDLVLVNNLCGELGFTGSEMDKGGDSVIAGGASYEEGVWVWGLFAEVLVILGERPGIFLRSGAFLWLTSLSLMEVF